MKVAHCQKRHRDVFSPKMRFSTQKQEKIEEGPFNEMKFCFEKTQNVEKTETINL